MTNLLVTTKTQVSSMLALFMKRACSNECARVARLVGAVDGNPDEFDRQTRREFNNLLALQGDCDGLDVLDVSCLEVQGCMEGTGGIEGITLQELVRGSDVHAMSRARARIHTTHTRTRVCQRVGALS